MHTTGTTNVMTAKGASAGTRAWIGATAHCRQLRRRSPAWPMACALGVAMWCSPGALADPLFNSLLGSWSGSGQIRYDDGKSEAIGCTAFYTGGGNTLRMAILCKSSTTEVEIRGQLTAQGDKLSGTWEERTFNASGEASGRVMGDKMNLSVTGGGFTGSMAVTAASGKQAVTISVEGIKMKSVNVTLGKS